MAVCVDIDETAFADLLQSAAQRLAGRDEHDLALMLDIASSTIRQSARERGMVRDLARQLSHDVEAGNTDNELWTEVPGDRIDTLLALVERW